jgi:hypothetical protein
MEVYGDAVMRSLARGEWLQGGDDAFLSVK